MRVKSNWFREAINLIKKERLKELDVLRAIAFIFVVEQHTMGGYSNIKGISCFYYEIFKFFYTFAKPAVAVFLCISAISLSYVYLNEFNYKKYYIKRIKYIYIPYIIWSIIYSFNSGQANNFSNSFIQILAGNACFHLWYMGMIIRLLLYFPIILWVAKKIHNQNIKLRIVVLITLILSYYEVSKYQNIISDKLIHFIFNNPTEIQEKIVNISPLFWFLYFVLGIYICLNYENFKTKILKFKIPVMITYMLLFIYAYLNEMDKVKFVRSLSLLYFVFTILFWYILSVSLSSKIKVYNCFNFISKFSFASYLAHVLVVSRVVNDVRLYFHDWLIVGLITWITTSLLTPLLIKFISYIPYSQFITGVNGTQYGSKSKKAYKNSYQEAVH